MGPGKLHKDDITWNPSDPNVLKMTLPGMHPSCLLGLALCSLPKSEMIMDNCEMHRGVRRACDQDKDMLQASVGLSHVLTLRPRIDGRSVVTCVGIGGLDILTRVTRRSETQQPPDRLDTSEYFEQARQWLRHPGIVSAPTATSALLLC